MFLIIAKLCIFCYNVDNRKILGRISMESVFEAYFDHRKQVFKEAVGVNKRYRISKTLYLISGILFLIACGLYILSQEVYLTTAYLMLGGFFIIMSAFFNDIYLNAMRKNANKTYGNAPVGYAFGEEYFLVMSSVVNSSVSYAAIDHIIETEDNYFLFLNKTSSYPVPKNAFTKGEAAYFANFIAIKTGKLIEKSSYKAKNDTAKKIIAIAVVSVYLVLCVVASAFVRGMDNTFTVDNYSIVLTNQFTEINSECLFEAYSDEVSIYTYAYDYESVKEYYETDTDDILEFIKFEMEDIKKNYENTVIISGPMMLPNDSAAYCYLCDVDGERYGYCDVVSISGDTYYLTSFACDENDLERLEQQLYDWAGTINVSDN